ncbi:hypothetical protein LCI18_008265 [Fusarium solani-melongenae]|uniref:Uncharacterized protein n=1 Tax=Fusarium solani subsp. cucurbitae TaxID=2747967 RepID=A0ACD3Z893_FUSSC|nr:hypothetical protein LCI18_008265 [Fusarium solani-melongenae]
MAFFLREQYGIGASGPGKDVVVTVSTGQSGLACLFFGVVAADGIYSAASPACTIQDLARQIQDGPGRLLVCSQSMKQVALAAAENVGLPKRNVLVLQSYPEVKLESADASVVCDFEKGGILGWRKITDQQELKQSKICVLYSSGTTGLPKGLLSLSSLAVQCTYLAVGVSISHLNLVAEVAIPASIHRSILDALSPDGGYYQYRTVGHLPTAHIAGLQGYFINPFYDGGTVFWMPTFNFDDFLRYCGKFKITFLFTVPPIYMAIASHPAVSDQFCHIQNAVSGAAPLTKKLQAAATGNMKMKSPVTQAWGLSETTAGATYVAPGAQFTVGSVGRLLPNVTMRLVDDDGRDVEPGEPGEALLKGPIVTQGYHNNPAASRDAFTPDGWLRTGDVMRVVHDELFIVDRKKELIKYKGLQVAPAELETHLMGHPASGTEVPRAYVVLVSQFRGKVTGVDLAEYVKSRVSDHKRLRGGVEFVSVIPRNAAGKIIRKVLKDAREKEMQAAKL